MNEPLKQSSTQALAESSALDWAAYYRALLPMQEVESVATLVADVPLELIVKPPPQIAPHKVAGRSTTKTIAYEYLAFTLGHEEYGIDILKIQEIRGYESVTRIANTPDFIKGVINLRGTIVPIIDMRIKFNLGEPIYDATTVVIILDMASQVMGMVVDTVSDVINLKPEQIKPPPELGLDFGTHYLVGLGTYEDRMVLLMDIESLMSSAEMGLMKAASA